MINLSIPAGTSRLINQGVIQGESTRTLTDDPGVAGGSDPTITPIVGPTAVSLLYFNAISVGNLKVQLNWATAAEVNNYGFKIKRAPVNDLQQAVQVGFVNSAMPGGNGSGTAYHYTDTVPQTGHWFYWLVDVDTQNMETPHNQPAIANVYPYAIYLPQINR
jgi:hypothetical protein